MIAGWSAPRHAGVEPGCTAVTGVDDHPGFRLRRLAVAVLLLAGTSLPLAGQAVEAHLKLGVFSPGAYAFQQTANSPFSFYQRWRGEHLDATMFGADVVFWTWGKVGIDLGATLVSTRLQTVYMDSRFEGEDAVEESSAWITQITAQPVARLQASIVALDVKAGPVLVMLGGDAHAKGDAGGLDAAAGARLWLAPRSRISIGVGADLAVYRASDDWEQQRDRFLSGQVRLALGKADRH